MIETTSDNVAVNLEIGATYVNGYGEQHRIMGPTKHHPEYVWSLRGDWFVRETGQYVYLDLKTGKYETRGTTWRDLWKRVK